VQLPGRENRHAETPLDRMDGLVSRLAPALRATLLRPSVFFGHSLGALVAFELARHLVRLGAELPQLLVVSGCRAPQLPRDEPCVHALPDDEFMASLRRLAGTPPEVLVEPELMALLLPRLRADFALYETYRFRAAPALDCDIAAFVGTADAEVAGAEMNAWRALCNGRFTTRRFAGDHFFVQSAVADVTDALRELIADRIPSTGSTASTSPGMTR
jgi:medium-chain acyl-[acyl-carrier-protein] hydrolase